MSRRLVVAVLAFVLGIQWGVLSGQETLVFGPELYLRSAGVPVTQTDQFAAVNGEGTLIIDIGALGDRPGVTSAVVTLNGERILGPEDFKPKTDRIEMSVPLLEENLFTVSLRGEPGAFLSVQVTQVIPFVEEFPHWNQPDLAVTDLTMVPRRVDPGDPVVVSVTMSNLAERGEAPATLVLLVDDIEVAQVAIDVIPAGGGTRYEMTWPADSPGRHWVTARLEVDAAGVADRGFMNNTRTDTVWVSGEAVPEPELEFAEIDFDALQLTAGEAADIPVTVGNPSYAPVTDVQSLFYIDGELIPFGGDDVMQLGPIISVDPGEEQTVQVPWSEVTPGQHSLQMLMALPDNFPDREYRVQKIWDFMVAGVPLICSAPPKNQWSSLGPSLLLKGSGGLPTSSVGRMHNVAFHPDNANIMYAAAPAGGVWKSGTGGGNWLPVGDGLPSLNVRYVAIDPDNPQIVYAATVTAYGSAGSGIFKTTNAGLNWDQFAPAGLVGNVYEMVIAYAESGELMIYAASDKGILRYKSTAPAAKTSDASEWKTIRSGLAIDIAVSPDDPALVYASMRKKVSHDGGTSWVIEFDGLYRTGTGDEASGDGDWNKLTSGLPALNADQGLVLDILKTDTKVLYAAMTHPQGKGTDANPLPVLGLYKSINRGDSWVAIDSYDKDELSGTLYNPFIRIHPNQPLIYFGGVKLYRKYVGVGPTVAHQITGIHDDMKEMEFDPFASSYYYITNDGGIWRCLSQIYGDDSCAHRNLDLRTTQFFDIDVSANDSNMMLGGTQDNGTILYSGSPQWEVVKDGDGNIAKIASADNKVLYAQHQYLHDDYGMKRCDKGNQCWWTDWKWANNGLPWLDKWQAYGDGWNRAQYTVHPNSPDGNYLLSQGDQVYATTDGGQNWYPKGPFGSNVKGYVMRVMVQPSTLDWFAGTSDGQIWYTSNPNAGWTLMFEHPCLSAGWKCSAPVMSLVFSPVDDTVMYAVFNIFGDKAYTRIWRFVMNPGPPSSWSPTNITDNLPGNLATRVISGDGHSKDIAYIGTNRGGVYRWDGSKPTYESWQPYNICLPPHVDVRDIVVAPNKELRAVTFGRGAWSVVTGP